MLERLKDLRHEAADAQMTEVVAQLDEAIEQLELHTERYAAEAKARAEIQATLVVNEADLPGARAEREAAREAAAVEDAAWQASREDEGYD